MKIAKNSHLKSEKWKEFTITRWKLQRIHPLKGQKSQKITPQKKIKNEP